MGGSFGEPRTEKAVQAGNRVAADERLCTCLLLGVSEEFLLVRRIPTTADVDR
jgi:hypothetical protein